MLTLANPSLRTVPAVVILAALATLAFAVGRRQPSLLPGDGSVAGLARHLESRGLPLRLVPASRSGADANAYLTASARRWEDLNGLPKDARRVGDWVGAVYCERVVSEDDAEVRLAVWDGACLRAGPFLFFGDPALLARIRQALPDAVP